MQYKTARKKAEELVGKMTPDECVSQLLYNSPAIPRLGIREYNWWNEALHGVARAGTATVFPQAIGLAATFDPSTVRQVAEVIAEEARAKYNQSVKYGDRDIYKGLTFWSPNINIFRDPHWGRGQETFGEDPFLTASMGCSFIRGLQGEGDFMKAAACAKHFAVHSGPEGKRHGFNAVVSRQDLFETYLPAFEWAVREAKVAGVMGAYNRTNDEPCCASGLLLTEILRGEWGFDGYVVSDCGAIADIHQNHHYTNSPEESAAAALTHGCDLNCGSVYQYLIDAYEKDLITEQDLRAAAIRLFTVRYLLGEFEPQRPYADIPYARLDCAEHRALNLKTAKRSLVLLKNEDGFLPLSPEKVRKIAAVGPNVLNTLALEGNYNGRASAYITVADGIRQVFSGAEVYVAEGCQLWHEKQNDYNGFGNLHSTGLSAAAAADVTVLCLGLDRTVEGEEMQNTGNTYSVGGDRATLYLPATQQKLAEQVCEVCENVVVVLLAGSPIDPGDKVRKKAKAIIQGWYPGAEGGLAIAQLLAGEFSPCGRLPITFPRGDAPLPDFEDYAMEGRTYRFSDVPPLYPFGFGLGYTVFAFDSASVRAEGDGYRIRAAVTNRGGMPATVPVQVYAEYTDSRVHTPRRQLCGLLSLSLDTGERREFDLAIPGYWVRAVDEEGHRMVPDGTLSFTVGDRQPDEVSDRLAESRCLRVSLT